MRQCWLVLFIVVAGCSPRVESIPPAAREQAPGAASPNGPWKAHGRLAVSWPGHHLEMECYLRREHGTTLHYALIADGGITLAEGRMPRAISEATTVSAAPPAIAVSRTIPPTVHPDLAAHIGDLERLLAEAFNTAPPHLTTWDGDVRRQDERQTLSTPGAIGPVIATRWYGGDPVLLRRVEGHGWPLELSDYRPTAQGLMAHHVRADGPLGAEITLRLDTVEALPQPLNGR